MPLVFQYGSNCDKHRLNSKDRLNGDAQDLDRAETIEDYDIAFDVWSRANGCAASDLIRTPGRKAWGVLYRLSDKGLERLKEIEGPRYEPKSIRIRNQAAEEADATTFLVKSHERRTGLWTSAEYVGHIVKGLRAHQVPEEYVQHVIDIALNMNSNAAGAPQEENQKIAILRTAEKHPS